MRASAPLVCTCVGTASVSSCRPLLSCQEKTAEPRGWPSNRSKNLTVSPAQGGCEVLGALQTICPALSDQSQRKASICSLRRRANKRWTAGCTSSPPATNSQAPPVAAASCRSKASTGAAPMPTANTRWPLRRAASMVSPRFSIWPSVISKTSAASPPHSLNTESSARVIWVPPRLARRDITQRLAVVIAAVPGLIQRVERWWVSSPKSDSRMRSPACSCSRQDAMASRAAAMLSPAIELEQSSSSLALTGILGVPGGSAKLVSTATWPACTGSAPNTMVEVCARPSITSTKSRSR